MENKGQKIGSIIIVVLISYFLLGLVGVLPAQYDVIRRAQGTQVEYGIIEYPASTENYPVSICYGDDGYIYFGTTPPSTIVKMSQDGNIIDTYSIPYAYGVNGDIIYIDGYLYTNAYSDKYLYKINIATGDVEEYTLTYESRTINVVSMTYLNGYLYFNQGGYLGKMDLNGNVLEFFMDTPSYTGLNSNNKIMTVDNYVWIFGYTVILEPFGMYCCLIKMDESGTYTAYITDIPDTSGLNWISYGDGYFYGLYYSYNPEIPDAILKIKPDGSEYYHYDVDGRIGDFSDYFNGKAYFSTIDNKIGEMTSSGQFKYYSIPTSQEQQWGQICHSNDTVFFCEALAKKIGKLVVFPSAPAMTGEFSFTQVGQWTKAGDGRAPFEYVGEEISITVEIETNETIETASLLWQDVGESDWNFGDMAQGQDGAWRFSIPKQEREGTVYYQVQATTSEGAELFSDTYGVQVVTTAETPAPSEPLVNPTVFYGVGTLLLVAVGIVINAPTKKYN